MHSLIMLSYTYLLDQRPNFKAIHDPHNIFAHFCIMHILLPK